MSGTLSSLGLGSAGALSAETIEKLKANDEKLQIDPIVNKIERISQQNQAYDLLNSLLSSLSASTSSLGSDLLYLDRSTSVTGDAVGITASSGVSPQNFSIEVENLATKEIQESDTFASKTALVASADGTISIGVGSSSFDINVTTTTTLEELSQLINDKAGETVKAQVLNVADGDFRLVLTSVGTGSDQSISVTDSSALLTTNLTQATAVQEGVDANFKYNGISFIRSSNEVDDIATGISISLQEVGSSNVSISQDSSKIAQEMKSFVTAYNTLSKEVNSTLTADVDKGTVGIFNGDNTVKSLLREIKNVLFSSDANGNSLVGFFSQTNSAGVNESAFGLTQSGVLTFNESIFQSTFEKDPQGAEKFLKYASDEDGNQTDGLLLKLDNFLESEIGFSGNFTRFGNSLNNQITALEDEATRTQSILDSRYETMFLRFAAYDKIIGGLERQFSALNLQIQAAINAK